ncbi:hypothetical protein F5B22DRAFT_646269 [Xylaria bambusicola]|uniref:uncharacterized protein n=1 Tax=Xylaria bambusicola TaxID=326684 RepID=UPI00200885A3|nr:uncharacterized protein F5B22DRAFT_646269 [Xylaria bambusicola]KAI0516925.1 hypothetical protein F5B22DRAFT_646269 [Xylaria bambusicola]
MDACHALEQPQDPGADNTARAVAAAGFFFAILSFLVLSAAGLYWCYKKRAQKNDSDSKSDIELAERGLSHHSIGDSSSSPVMEELQMPPKPILNAMPDPKGEFEEIDLSTPPTDVRTSTDQGKNAGAYTDNNVEPSSALASEKVSAEQGSSSEDPV